MSLVFHWDREKADTNARKHGVTFEEAVSVFDDPLARIFADDWHSKAEDREIIIGHSGTGRLMLVVFSERPKARLRIISARHTTPQEHRDYERQSPN